MADLCKTCAHWPASGLDWDEYERPLDQDTFEPMETGFNVRRCQHPKLLFCERPLEANGFAVKDGSTYFAALYTGEDFGCVRHSDLENNLAAPEEVSDEPI